MHTMQISVSMSKLLKKLKKTSFSKIKTKIYFYSLIANSLQVIKFHQLSSRIRK